MEYALRTSTKQRYTLLHSLGGAVGVNTLCEIRMCQNAGYITNLIYIIYPNVIILYIYIYIYIYISDI